jgi:hypothetical protein
LGRLNKGQVEMKRLTREEKKEKAIVDIINQMFVIAGHDVTYDDIVGVDKWWQKYTMTVAQGDELEEWGKKYLMKELKLRAAYAEKEMMWFSVMWGLKYSDFDEHIKSKIKTNEK